jgi:hypothetical protein
LLDLGNNDPCFTELLVARYTFDDPPDFIVLPCLLLHIY